MERGSRRATLSALAAVCLVGLGGAAGAERLHGGIPLARLSPEEFPSSTAAAAAAAARYRPASIREDREYMGAIHRLAASRFAYSVAAGRPGRDAISVRVSVPPGTQLVAVWHTHGAPHTSREYFSKIDTALANRLQLPVYLGTPSGDLRVYRPGDPTLTPRASERIGLGERSGYAVGALVAIAATRPDALAAVPAPVTPHAAD